MSPKIIAPRKNVSIVSDRAEYPAPLPKDEAPVKLPRAIEADERAEKIEDILVADLRPLWENGKIPVPHLEFSPKLEKALTALNSFHQLEKGLENIEKILMKEKLGLEALYRKTNAPLPRRISRLILIANDGTERFYRSCESLLLEHDDRLLCIRVSASAERFSEKLFGKERRIKAVLVTEKEAVANVLFAILP